MCKENVFIYLIATLFIVFACNEPNTDELSDKGEIFNLKIKSLEESDTIGSYQEMRGWFDYLCSPELGGRYSGSYGIEKAVEYIINIIGQNESLEVDVFETDKCVMRNIVYHIQGTSDSLIVLGAHYDAYGYVSNTPLPGADDNMSGVAVLLTVIKSLQVVGIYPQYNIDICFFDGEEIGRYGSKQYLYGCKQKIKKYINIDTCGNKDFGACVLYDNKHPYLKEEFEGFIHMVKDVTMKTAVYNPKGFTTDCQFFEQKHIPFVSIQNDKGSSWLHTFDDDLSHISFEKIDNIAKGIVLYLHTFSELSSNIQEVNE